MGSELAAFTHANPTGEAATYPIARLARCLAALLLVAGNNPAASSRLARQCARRTLRCIQLRFLGLTESSTDQFEQSLLYFRFVTQRFDQCSLGRLIGIQPGSHQCCAVNQQAGGNTFFQIDIFQQP